MCQYLFAAFLAQGEYEDEAEPRNELAARRRWQRQS